MGESLRMRLKRLAFGTKSFSTTLNGRTCNSVVLGQWLEVNRISYGMHVLLMA